MVDRIIDIHPDFIFVPEAMDIGAQREHVVKRTNLAIVRVAGYDRYTMTATHQSTTSQGTVQGASIWGMY